MFKDIIIRGARHHNLKNISLNIPRNQLIIITGLSGSGKSSLAFDTIYAEGQRRYIESLSAYARQFLERMDKPDVDSIEGLSPAIAIEQKTTSKNPRSTVGTITEIYDYLRVLYARAGIPYCPQCDRPIRTRSPQEIVDQLITFNDQQKVTLLAPIITQRKGEHKQILAKLAKDGFTHARIDGKLAELDKSQDLIKTKKHTIEVVIDRITINPGAGRRLTDSVELGLRIGGGILLACITHNKGHKNDHEELFNERLACDACGISLPELTPQMFSFNSPQGACPACDGLGIRMFFDPNLIIINPNLPLNQYILEAWNHYDSNYFSQSLKILAHHLKLDLLTSWKDLTPNIQKYLLYGAEKNCLEIKKQNDSPYLWEGIIPYLERLYRENINHYSIRKELEHLMNSQPCTECGGTRLKTTSLAIKISGLNIWELSNLSIYEAAIFFKKLSLPPRESIIAKKILQEISQRLGFMTDVGLNYLTLTRPASTLSGGENHRIRLATQIGSALIGVLYVLDEPSIGLHQRDNQLLLATLRKIRDLGNTVLVVEHDEQTIRAADYIIDMGPGAGEYGGQIVFAGTPDALMNKSTSLTGQYLSGTLTIDVPKKRRNTKQGWIKLKGCREHNLKNIDASFPLGVITCVTGVSGSGKSSLVLDTLYQNLIRHFYQSKKQAGIVDQIEGLEYLDKIINIDQSPIGRTPRSNPATYTGIFTPIRELYAQTLEARARGYKPGRFSFNMRGGRCSDCEGEGIIKVEMLFLPNVYVRCETCHGLRYNRDTLEISYKGKNIAQILNMPCNEALQFFKDIPSIYSKLKTIIDVGLDYIRLGQTATTLSGGEAQRIKLSRELSKRPTGRTLYILDEPTTGLHFADVKKLLIVLTRLVELGNTVIIIEHNLEVIKTADWVIDLGPEGGNQGGYIISFGTPEKITKIKESYTGKYLKKILK